MTPEEIEYHLESTRILKRVYDEYAYSVARKTRPGPEMLDLLKSDVRKHVNAGFVGQHTGRHGRV